MALPTPEEVKLTQNQGDNLSLIPNQVSTNVDASLKEEPAPVISNATPTDLLKERNTISDQNPNLGTVEATRLARQNLEEQKKQQELVAANTKSTGITPLDNELKNIEKQRQEAFSQQFKDYATEQGNYTKNKNYYSNFDAVNNTFNNVLKGIQGKLSASGKSTLSNEDMTLLAQQYGVSLADIQNPTNLYSQLQTTEEGSRALGITGRQNEIDSLITSNERLKADAKTNLERTLGAVKNQISDVELQGQRNVDWAIASGAWSNASRSSGYQQGIENMKADTANIAAKLYQQADYASADNAKYMSRLQEDFEKSFTQAKAMFDDDVRNLKFDTGIKLNGLEAKYGSSSKELLKALNVIAEEYGTKSFDAMGKYVSMATNINRMALNNVNTLKEMNSLSNSLKNTRYNELLANGGALLSNTSLTSIANEVKAGKMDPARYMDIKNLMANSIVESLRGVKTVTQEDVATINDLLNNGLSPIEIISRIQGGNLATPNIDSSGIATYSQQKRGRTNLQCGELTNDYWQQQTGKPISNDPSINTYRGKVEAVKKLGESPTPVVGGVFTLDTGTATGHIGIVQKVNADGSIVVLEANREGSVQGGVPMLHTYQDTSKMTFSKAPSSVTANANANANVNVNVTVNAGSKNTRPDRNNNPGNVKAYGNEALSIPGAVGVDDQNHIIFSNPTDGYNWMVKDLTAKLTGGSDKKSKLTGEVLGPNSTLADLASVYAEDPNWINNVSQISGYSKDAKLSSIDVNKLAPAVAKQEGFSGQITPKEGTTAIPTGPRTYTPVEKALMDEYLKSPTDPKALAGLTSAKLKVEDVNNYKNPTPQGDGVNGSLGIPFDFQSRLWNMIPAQLKNSEGEKATAEQNIVNLYKSGMNVEDAALMISGFSIKDPAQKKEALDIIRQARGIGEKLPEGFFGEVSDYINRGDMKGAKAYANRVIEGSLKAAIGEDFVSTPNLDFSKASLDRINGFIEKNKDKIGPLDGRIADLEKTFFNDPDYQALKTLLSGSLADVRRTFGGTAVTSTELGALRDFIGLDTKMPIKNLMTALQTNYDTLENKYNTQRGFYGVGEASGEEDVGGGTTNKGTKEEQTQQILDLYRSKK